MTGAVPRVEIGPSGPFASETDWETAVEIHRSHATTMFLALFTRSLPASFCSPSGAAVLDPAGVGVPWVVDPHRQSIMADAFLRLGGTARHIDGFFDRDGEVRRRHLQAIRRGHDLWRQRVQDAVAAMPGPRPDVLADPLNDEQILGTACTFVVPVRELFDEFRVPGSESIDWDAWSRVWCDIAVAQGADESYVREQLGGPVTYERFRAVSERIEAGHRARSLAGVRLMRNVLDDLRDGLPHWSRNTFMMALGVFGEDEVLDLVLVPPRPGSGVARTLTRSLGRVPGVRSAVWWWIRTSVAQVRHLVDEAERNTTVAELFPPDT
jgi:hypothetical protein